MKIDDYINLYGESYFIKKCTSPNEIDCYMFKFTDETACQWGGPFEGNYALGILFNHLLPDVRGKFRDLPTKESLDKYKLNKIREINHQYPIGKLRDEKLKLLDYPYDFPTQEQPYQIYLTGNDDTSYSRFFSNLNVAIEEFELLKYCQPLDINKDIYPNYIFTN